MLDNLPQRTLLFALLLVAAALGPARAQAPAVSAKQFPTGYFYQYHQAPLKQKSNCWPESTPLFKKVNREKLGLIAKGAVIDKLGPDPKTYDRLTILDESGLIIIARKVPNLYYHYAGPAPINPNIYLVIKNAKVNFPGAATFRMRRVNLRGSQWQHPQLCGVWEGTRGDRSYRTL